MRSNWEHLTQRPEGQEKVIDGVRAIAILWVVSLHMVFIHYSVFPQKVFTVLTAPSMGWLVNGLLGVDMFFVISGYLIGSILFSEFRDTRTIVFSRFYVRRFLRLIPVYTVVMLLALILFFGAPGGLRGANAENAWANLLYVNNLLPISKQFVDWCWSLAIEEQFYLLFPICMLVFMRRSRGRLWILVGLFVLSGVIRSVVLHAFHLSLPLRDQTHSPAWNLWFDVEYDKLWMRFGGLIAGVIGAYLTCFRVAELKRFFARTRLVTVLATVSLVIFAHFAYTSVASTMFCQVPVMVRDLWFATYHDAFSLSLLFLILTALHAPSLLGRTLRSILSWNVFYPIAQLSYSIYLTHEMVFGFLFPTLGPKLAPRLGMTGAMVADAVVALAIVFMLTLTLYLFVERPCMRLRSHPKVLGIINALSEPKRSRIAEEVG